MVHTGKVCVGQASSSLSMSATGSQTGGFSKGHQPAEADLDDVRRHTQSLWGLKLVWFA
jgi:hypothetical protein